MPTLRDAMQAIIKDNTHLTERCETMFVELNGPLAAPLEPTAHAKKNAALPWPRPRSAARPRCLLLCFTSKFPTQTGMSTASYHWSGNAGDTVQQPCPSHPPAGKLECEERFATLEKQTVLAQYVGWGGLGLF